MQQQCNYFRISECTQLAGKFKDYLESFQNSRRVYILPETLLDWLEISSLFAQYSPLRNILEGSRVTWNNSILPVKLYD